MNLFDKAMGTINGIRSRIKNLERAEQEFVFDWELQGGLKWIAILKSIFLGKPEEVQALEKQIKELETPKEKVVKHYSVIDKSITR